MIRAEYVGISIPNPADGGRQSERYPRWLDTCKKNRNTSENDIKRLYQCTNKH